MKRHRKLDIALEMLDASICEHLDYGRHFSAYNLAAVAEEILGKHVRVSGRIDASERALQLLTLVREAVGAPSVDRKVLKKHISALKNSIKHMDSQWDDEVTTNIEASARQKIGSAIDNLFELKLKPSADVVRFNSHQTEKHRDRNRKAVA